jgi:hypothetical protein
MLDRSYRSPQILCMDPCEVIRHWPRKHQETCFFLVFSAVLLRWFVVCVLEVHPGGTMTYARGAR